jgi:hypothetical protein
VPCYGLPFAVLIRCQPNGLRLGCRLLKLRHQSFLVIGNFIDWSKAVLDIDAEIALAEIADMSIARHHFIVLAEEFLYRFSLSRRLYYYQVFEHKNSK